MPVAIEMVGPVEVGAVVVMVRLLGEAKSSGGEKKSGEQRCRAMHY